MARSMGRLVAAISPLGAGDRADACATPRTGTERTRTRLHQLHRSPSITFKSHSVHHGRHTKHVYCVNQYTVHTQLNHFFFLLCCLVSCRLNFGIILYCFHEMFLECGNFCLVSARLSLKRHYLFTHYFQSSFRAVSEQFFLLINILLST